MDIEKNFIIYIPGLFSSNLLKGNDIIWPVENKDFYKIYFNNYFKNIFKKIFFKLQESDESQNLIINEYIEKLSDKNLKPGNLTHNNNNILELIKKNNNNNYYVFSYDWREDLNITIDIFNKNIEMLDIPNKNITLISHSAGGIIAYKYINEIGKYGNGKNFKKINKYITIGCPIEGSVKALSIIMGLCHQSILSPENLKDILDKGFFKSIYQLIPSNVHNLFFYKNSKHLLEVSDSVKILLNNGFTEKTIRQASEFRKEMNNLIHNPYVDFLFIVGVYNKEAMCTGFNVDPDTNALECVYDYNSGDGTVLVYEAIPTLMHNYRVRYVTGKHSYLTEYDETLNIIENEINAEPIHNNIVISKVISNDNDIIKFCLFVIINNNKKLVKDIKAEKIIFTQKTHIRDITKQLKHDNKKNVFYFNTTRKYGLLKFKNITVLYYDSNTDDDPSTVVIKENFKRLYVEINNPSLNFLF